mmetsp:Transcript_95820/g.189937  ORF Transcript_95820/g.189937 Transcript_95820/m.189937 type:complete len:599 (-) Transcript_95820:167-1963(-)
MVNSFAVLAAGLIAWPAPVCSVRDDSVSSDGGMGIEERLAAEVQQHAQLLQAALSRLDADADDAKLSVTEQRAFTDNLLFAMCGLSDSSVRELADDALQLRAVGKLAKSGNFFASTDSRWLVKGVSLGEQSKLIELGHAWDDIYNHSDCHGFNLGILLPIPLTFITDRQPYLVMRNETKQLENRTWPEWQVTQAFDVKPLPNLSEHLANLIITLTTGWLGSFAPLSRWDGWDAIKTRLHRDCMLLTSYGVVDFSLFIHVLQRTRLTVVNKSSTDLSAKDGCIVEPSHAAIVCFAVLDYLMQFSSSRKLESRFKADKFQDYGEKMVHAFACIGDVNSKGCEAYHDYGAIETASVKEAKVTFLGSETFGKTYECQVGRPKLRYEIITMVGGGTPIFMSKIEDKPVIRESLDLTVTSSKEIAVLLPEVLQIDGLSHDGTTYDANIASWLQEAVSSNNGGHIVSSDYEQFLEDGLGQPEQGFQLDDRELAACKKGIKVFATNSWRGRTNHKDLGNVVWSPQTKSIFVVRGKNKLYSNSEAVLKMRKKHCFMLVRFFRCQEKGKKRAIFDYKTSFGSIEVLQVIPSASSGDDFNIFRNQTVTK